VAWWANAGVVVATLIGIGTLIVMIGKGILWLWGKTLGQRVDSYAAEVRAMVAEMRRYRHEQAQWQRWHEERWHGYPPQDWRGNGYHPVPTPTLDSAVRSHRR